MNVLIDTNVIVDVALERQPFYNEADQVFALVETGQIEGYISAAVFSDIYYIVHKIRGRDWTLRFLERLSVLCRVATVNEATIALALTANFADFEDAIQYSTAVTNALDAIVTRNTQDFRTARLQIFTPTALKQHFGESA